MTGGLPDFDLAAAIAEDLEKARDRVAKLELELAEATGAAPQSTPDGVTSGADGVTFPKSGDPALADAMEPVGAHDAYRAGMLRGYEIAAAERKP